VARVFDLGSLPDGAPFIAMELLEGKDLHHLLRHGGPLAAEVAAGYMLQACEGLLAAHASRVIHLDIKPANLFLARRPQAPDIIKLLDFGISKVASEGPPPEPSSPPSRAVTAAGSPLYMSPEQIKNSTAVDARADIWSIGCVLYELLTGRPPFQAASLIQICTRVLEQAPVSPRSIRPDLAPRLEAVILRCLEKDPNRRFREVGELTAALAPFASGAPVRAARVN
jgi:serine/threonine-protein kinase